MSDQIIILGDCRDYDAKVFDVMMVDPPYREHVHASAVSQSASRGARKRDLGFQSLAYSLRRYIARAAARAQRWSLIYSDIESLTRWRISAEVRGAKYIRALPWIRWSMPQLSGDRPPSGCEMVSIFWGAKKGAKSWNGPGNLTHLDHKCLRGEGKHPTEKALDQALDLVSWFSDPGEIVFEPTAGSGTTALACKLLGRAYVGFEIDPVWAEKANARINASALSDRDTERYGRWVASQLVRKAEAERCADNTAKQRAKADAARDAKRPPSNPPGVAA